MTFVALLVWIVIIGAFLWFSRPYMPDFKAGMQSEMVEPWWLEHDPETMRVVIEEIGEDNLPSGLVIHARGGSPRGAYTSDTKFRSTAMLRTSRPRPQKGERNGVKWEQQGTRFRVVYDQETNQGETFNSLREALDRIDSL